MRGRKPPVCLHCCRVEQFAIRDRLMRFTGHRLLFSGDKEVGPVPRLALGRDRQHGVMLFHCDTRWNVVGAEGFYPDLRSAKARAERFYQGISKAWVRTGYTKAQANRYLQRLGHNKRCSICSKPWFDIEALVEVKKRKLAFCDACIRELYELISYSPPSSSTLGSALNSAHQGLRSK